MELPLPTTTAWPEGDEVGMGVEINMLDKSFSNRRNVRNYLQLNTARNLRAAVLEIYPSTSDAHSSRYPLKSHCQILLRRYEGAVQ